MILVLRFGVECKLYRYVEDNLMNQKVAKVVVKHCGMTARLGTSHHVILQSKHQLMIASAVLLRPRLALRLSLFLDFNGPF